jgi:hypothetical protein
VTETDPTLDYLDYTSIAFPSDKLTIMAIRKRFPHRFDVDGDPIVAFFEANADQNSGDPMEAWLRSLITAERYLARHAYEEVLGVPWTCLTESGDTRDDAVKRLSQYYMHFGIATGLQHAEQLIRSFEAEAAAQAKSAQRPPRRSR